MKKQRREKKRSPILKGIFLSAAVLFLLGVVTLSILSARVVDEEYDEALFSAVGEEHDTRFYYHAEGGTPIEGIEDYRALEWESERIADGAECIYTPLDEIPQALKNAFVAIEDIRFYRHHGVDVLRTGKAVLNSVFHFSPRFGGSTITQQLIKNIGGEKDVTAVRKGKEMLRALSLERRHSKNEILEAYLNIVPMSQNRIGVGAGAALYFGKTPMELTLAECAGIAAVTRAPSLYAPERNMENYLARRNTVLAVMRQEGMITEAEYRQAVKEEVSLAEQKTTSSRTRSWYTETVLKDLKNALLEKGYTESAAKALMYRGGLRIYTAVNIEAQRLAEEYFEKEGRFSEYGDGFAASFVLLSPQSGNLAAVIGNAGKKQGNLLLNHATESLHAPGSALKPIALYAPAVEEGRITEATVFDDVPCEFHADGSFWPHNADGTFSGLIGCADALAHSKNTVAVSLYRMLGAEHIYAHLNKLGIRTLVRGKSMSDGRRLSDLSAAPLALGELTDGVSLLALARAYLPFADHGKMHGVRSFLLVTDAKGNVILSPKKESEQVYSDTTASVMTHMLRQVVEEGSASALTIAETLDTAGKTGTSSGARNRFFIGYTPYYLAGVWCGYENGTKALGGNAHLMAFDHIMREIHSAIPANENAPTFTMAKGLRAVRVCADSGLCASALCALDPRGARTRTVWLKEEEIPHALCTVHTLYRRSQKAGGILLESDAPVSDEKKVALIRVENRDFPVNIPIADAEYTCRDLHGTMPSEKNEAFYATLLEKDRYAGKPPHGERPYNAWGGKISEKKEEVPSSPPSPSAPVPKTEKKKQNKKAPRRFWDGWKNFWSKK